MKVLLVDDHALFREGIALLLQPLTGSLAVSYASTCEEAFQQLSASPDIDLVLMDLVMPGMSGVEGIRTIRDKYPATPVVALSSSDDKATVLQALDAGAMGFIPKSSTTTVLLGALQLILAKGIYLPPSVFLANRQVGAVAPAPTAARPGDLGLTARQGEVLYLLLQGKTAKLIARELDLSISTVKAHTSAVLRALNVTTRTQAVVAAGKIDLRFS